MIKLLLILAVALTYFSLPYPAFMQGEEEKEKITNKNTSMIDEITSIVITEHEYQTTLKPLHEIKEMLLKEATTLNLAVINKVLTTLKCASEYNIEHNNILTIIDYSLPSNEKRLWIFDLKEKKLLFHTYVSHGIKSGVLLSNNFSNKYNSKASSIGVYKTEKAYQGRHGLSLQLDGLEAGFNDNAANRAVVMHGGWYVDENFIKKYGRTGRSWGCPAVPENLTKPIINTIKDKSLFVIYYPSDNWFLKSKFLNCDILSSTQNTDDLRIAVPLPVEENEQREGILFADINQNNQREENEPIVVISADSYERIFHTKVPLERMLRRQINNTEYIALSHIEFENLITYNDKIFNNNDGLNAVYFVIPVVKMERGYYATEMKIVTPGKIKGVRPNIDSSKIESIKSYTVHFEANSFFNLRSTNQFIRWLGL